MSTNGSITMEATVEKRIDVTGTPHTSFPASMITIEKPKEEKTGCKCALSDLLTKGLCEYCDKKSSVKCDGYVKPKSKRTDEDDVKVIPQSMSCVKTHNNINLVVISKENMIKVLNESYCIVIDNTVICVED